MSAIEEKQTPQDEEEEEVIDPQEFKSVLEKSFNGERFELVSLSAKRLSLLGDSFCSVVARVNATIRRDGSDEDENLSLITKRINPVGAFLDWPIAFKKEVFAYTELIQAYRSFERESGIDEGETIDISPKYFGHRNSRDGNSDDTVDEDSLLILEDLCSRGYYVCDRLSGLDFDHATKTVSALSRYHAIGLALKQRHPDRFDAIVKRVEPMGLDVVTIKGMYRELYKILKNQPRLSRYIPKIEQCFVHRKTLPSPWVGVTHGDFRTNNLLFRKDSSGNVADVKFIDFQNCGYDSTLGDLMSIWVKSVDDQTLENRVDDLLDMYYEVVTSWLNRFGCDMDVFSRAEFERELKAQAISTFPICILGRKFAMHQVGKETKDCAEFIKDVMNGECSEAFIDALLTIIGIYERKGWF